MIEQPLKLTFARWRRLVSGRHSITRELEYEALQGVRLEGRVLDIGGKRGNSYMRHVALAGTVEILNIDPATRPDIVADLNRGIPLEDGCYDTVISLNTFEHVENEQLAWTEMLRVLRPGGAFHVMVPFLYRVHGDPSDFHRHTAYHWELTLSAAGLDSNAYRVRPLTWDSVGVGYSMFEPRRSRFKPLTRSIFLCSGLIAQMRKPDKRWSDYALAYYIHGRKVAAKAAPQVSRGAS